MAACRMKSLMLSLVVTLVALPASAITVSWVTVGDAGNAADTTTTYGAVGYEFQIMRYEWTNSQYVDFLNAVDPEGTNPNSIFNAAMDSDVRGGITNTGSTNGSRYAAKANMGDKPVNYVSWWDAARVANWLQAGSLTYSTTVSGSAAINIGAYTLSGSTSGTAPAKNAGAQYWIPLQNEWYKAAYYKGSGTSAGYWTYATQSNSDPIAVGATVVGTGTSGGVSPVITGNVANYNVAADWNSQDGNVTTVGTNGSPSAYGAFDMSGNVSEWNDAAGTANVSRGRMGGDWQDTESELASSHDTGINTATEYDGHGFRLAFSPVPEIDPAGTGSVLTLVGGALGVLERRRRRTR